MAKTYYNNNNTMITLSVGRYLIWLQTAQLPLQISICRDFGPDLGTLKGNKTTRKPTSTVREGCLTILKLEYSTQANKHYAFLQHRNPKQGIKKIGQQVRQSLDTKHADITVVQKSHGHGSRLFDSRRVVKIDFTAYFSRRDRGREGPRLRSHRDYFFISRQQEPHEGVHGKSSTCKDLAGEIKDEPRIA